MKVFIGMPCYTDAAANVKAVQAAIGQHGLRIDCTFEAFGSSLLAKGFNYLWSRALSKDYDFFAMVHSDIVPQQGWGQIILEQLCDHEADLVSCIVPIKNHTGNSSCAIGDPKDRWTCLFRFTTKQLGNMPLTFTAADVGWPDCPLLLNTGCWIADLRKPWVRECNESGELRASFQVDDRIVYRPDKTPTYLVQSESEDWRFSRILWEMGCKTMATQAVSLEHFGSQGWPNHVAFGESYDHLVRRSDVLIQYGLAAEKGVDSRGFFTDMNPEGHRFDPGLAEKLKQLKGSVLDLGCGTCRYVKVLGSNGREIRGIDGNPHTSRYGEPRCVVADLTEPLEFDPFDWVLSLEVGEHIPEAYESVFLDNVVRHARHGVVLSWSLPTEAGRGHVNCRPNEYVIEQMKNRGFLLDPDHTQALRKAAAINYFKESLMSFVPERS